MDKNFRPCFVFDIIRPSDSITKVKALAVGSYLFELKVTDNGGLSSKDTMHVIVQSVASTNHPPVANAGADQTITLPTNTVNLDGSGSTDPENNITNYMWTKISGPSSFNIANTNATQTQVTNLVQGIYQFELKVTDAGGLFSKDTVQVIVNPATSTACNSNRPLVSAQLTAVGTVSEARFGIAAASAGNKIVFAGGYSISSNSSTYYSTVDIYDIVTQTWSTAALSEPRTEIAAIAAGNKIFFAGGYSRSSSNVPKYYSTVDIYDVSTNTWSVASLSEPRSLIATATVGNKVFFAGGGIDNNISWFGSGNSTSKVDVYNMDTQTWSTAALSEPRTGIAAVTVQNKVYFAGGGGDYAYSSSGLGVTNRIDIYDNVTNSWSVSSLNESRTYMASIAVGDKIYWAGGMIWPALGVFTCSVEIYDVNTTNSTVTNLHGENWWQYNAGHNAVVKNNKIVFCIAPWNSPEFDIYDINTNAWSIGVLPSVCTDNSIISVNNTIYIAGGFVNGVISNQVWKLDF